MDRYWNEMWPFLLVPIAFVLWIGSFVLRTATDMDLGWIGFLAAFGIIVLVFGGRAFIVTRNGALDQEIHQPLGHEVSSPPSS